MRTAFEEHLEETKGQVQRLEQVFELLGSTAKAKTCPGMRGLVEEGEEVIAQDATEELKDAALIGAAQRVEHYEMAAYGTARALAEQIGNDEVVELLQQTLDEEKAADEKLTGIAQQLLAGMSNEEGAVRSQKAPRTRTSRA